MAARRLDDGLGTVDRHFTGRFDDDDGPTEIERHRAWIATRLLQGIGVVLLLTCAVVLFDSL